MVGEKGKEGMNSYKNDISLGCIAKDTITGFKGVVVNITEWLNGCVRVGIQPKELREGKPVDAQVFDIEQLECVSVPKQKTVVPSGGDRPTVGRAKDPR